MIGDPPLSGSSRSGFLGYLKARAHYEMDPINSISRLLIA